MTRLSRFSRLRVLHAAEHSVSGAIRRYFFLAVALALLCGSIVLAARAPRFEVTQLPGILIGVMLLLNHLAFGFALPPSRTRRRLRAAAWAWTCFCLGVVFTVSVVGVHR